MLQKVQCSPSVIGNSTGGCWPAGGGGAGHASHLGSQAICQERPAHRKQRQIACEVRADHGIKLCFLCFCELTPSGSMRPCHSRWWCRSRCSGNTPHWFRSGRTPPSPPSITSNPSQTRKCDRRFLDYLSCQNGRKSRSQVQRQVACGLDLTRVCRQWSSSSINFMHFVI